MSENVTYSAISPIDGSLWMTTAGHGLVRIGRNGKAFAYSAQKGDFACDNIDALAFDDDGTLWMLDAEGTVWSYTSFSGFVKQDSAPVVLQKQQSAEVKAETEVPDAPEPVGTARSYHWYGGWWMLLVTGLLLLALFLKNSKRKEAGSSTFETKVPSWKPAVPAPQTVAPAHVEPAKPVAPAAPATRPAAPRPSAETTVSTGAFASKVKEIVTANYTNAEFGVEDVARILGMSRVHLNRKLKEESAPSPSTLIKKMRMDHAAALLRAGNDNISEVAAKSGFSSAAYFSSAFKEYFNISPTSFK